MLFSSGNFCIELWPSSSIDLKSDINIQLTVSQRLLGGMKSIFKATKSRSLFNIHILFQKIVTLQVQSLPSIKMSSEISITQNHALKKVYSCLFADAFTQT